MRELIDAFFRERSIVNHHIASFNDFLPTIDNPNSRMQRIVDNLRPPPGPEPGATTKSDKNRTQAARTETGIGRKPDRPDRIGYRRRQRSRLGSRWVRRANGP